MFKLLLDTCVRTQTLGDSMQVLQQRVLHAGSMLDACVHAGLEVRVAFSGVWKDSLSELSGGQRSLLALSLILAMLLFKPAPIYILDEVHPAWLGCVPNGWDGDWATCT